jgi:hypothetical protein
MHGGIRQNWGPGGGGGDLLRTCSTGDDMCAFFLNSNELTDTEFCTVFVVEFFKLNI